MELPIPNEFQKLWDVWDIRCCILFSLFLQAFFFFFASLRQQSKSTLLLFFLWSAYLLADWVAAVAIGIITQSQGNDCDPRSWKNEHLFAFWASFLLLHLGGPDKITSFSLEDNEFWLRHLFGLILQASIKMLIFSLIFLWYFQVFLTKWSGKREKIQLVLVLFCKFELR